MAYTVYPENGSGWTSLYQYGKPREDGAYAPTSLMTSEQYLAEQRYMAAEANDLGDKIGYDRQAESAEQQADWDYRLRQQKELEVRARELNARRAQLDGAVTLQEFYTPDGPVFFNASDGKSISQFEKEMGERGLERGKDWGTVEHFSVKGVIDRDGNVLMEAPINISLKEGDKAAESIKQYTAQHKDMGGMLLPEMFAAIGFPVETLGEELAARANRGLQAAQHIEEDRRQGKRALGQMGVGEAEGSRVGFGGLSLEEKNTGRGAFGKVINWSESINPLAGLADEYGQATEAELGTPEGLEEMRRRVANGEDTLTWGERVGLGLVGDVGDSLLKDPEAAYEYLVNRRRARWDDAENRELRGTTFLADVAEMTESSARMGAEFALVNTLTGGGATIGRAGKALTAGQQALRGAAALGTEAALHAPAKARQLMADKVAFNPATNQLEVAGKGEGAVTATLKGVAAPMLEYATEMYAMRLLWNPVGRGLKRITPTRVKDFTTNLVAKAKGTQAAHWLDSVVVSPGLDTVRKISERTGFHISPMGVLLEEPILEEIPANVLSSMFNLEGESERQGGLWGQMSGGASDAWDAFVETLVNAPAMMMSTLLFGGGTGMAVKGTTGLINYNMSKPRVTAALRELGATEAELKGKDKSALNDLLFEKLRDVKTAHGTPLTVYSPEAIAQMPRETLERKLREFGWADLDLGGVSEEQMRTRLLNGFKEMGNAAWTDRAIQKLTTGLYAAARHGMNHSNILERLEADIFERAPLAYDAETRERMREVMLLRSMAGSGQYRGTLAGSLMADQSLRLYASLGNEARRALDTFEDGFVAARQTAVPTYEQIGTGAYQPSTFRQPMQESEMRNNGKGGYTDPNTGISITATYAEGSKTPRYRVDVDPSATTQAAPGSVDAELGKLGIRAPRVRLPMGMQNIFDNLQDARRFADRISSYSNTLKQELLTKAKAAQAMYARVRGENGNGIVTLARPADAPEAIRDEIMDNLMAGRQEGENAATLMHRFQTVMGFTSAQDGKTYVFLDNHSSPYSLLQTVQHEGFHEGLLSAFLGDRKQVEAFVQELTDGRNGFPAWVSENAKTLKNPREVEEFLAALAETKNAGPGFLHSVNRAMRRAMALNGNVVPSEMDVNDVIYGAWKAQRLTPDLMPKPRAASGSFAKVTGINGPVEDMGDAVAQKFGPAVSREDTDRAILERDRRVADGLNKAETKGTKPATQAAEAPNQETQETPTPEVQPTEAPQAEVDVEAHVEEDEGETVTTLDEEPEAGGASAETEPEEKEAKPEAVPAKEAQEAATPPPKNAGKKPRKGQVTSADELQPEGEGQGTPAPEAQQPAPEAEATPAEPAADGTVRNGRIAWGGKWLKPGGIRGHQGVFVADTEDGEALAFFQTEDWGLGDKETRPMRRGTPVADHYVAARRWMNAGMPGLDEAKAQLPVEDVDGASSEDGYIRWEKFWLKPGTHDGEEGYFIHDARGGEAKGFYKPGAWRTKAGKERPGKVTNFVDDKLTGERVSAAYRWSRHEKLQEEQARKAARQAEQAETTQTAPEPPPQPEQEAQPQEPSAPQAETPTLKVFLEDKDGRSVHVNTEGLTNTKGSGRFFEELAAVKAAAVRDGLAPEDAIVVGIDTNGAFVAFDENADALERVAPTYMPIKMVVDGEVHQTYVVKWNNPKVAGAVGDFFDKHAVIAVDRRNDAAKITKPKNRGQARPTQQKDEAGERTPPPQATTPQGTATQLPEGGVSLGNKREAIAAQFPRPTADRLEKAGFAQSAKQAVRGKDGVANDAIVLVATGGLDGIAAFDEDASAVARAIPGGYVVSFGDFIPGVETESHSIASIRPAQLGQAIKTLNQRGRDVVVVDRDFSATHFPAQTKPSARIPQTREEANAFLRDHIAIVQVAGDTETVTHPTVETMEKRPAKAQKPEKRPVKPRKTTAATQELQEVEDLLGGLGMLREGALPPEDGTRLGRQIRSRQETSHTAASPEQSLATTPSANRDDARIVSNHLTDLEEKVAVLGEMRDTLLAPAMRGGRTPINADNLVATVASNIGLARNIPGSWYGDFNPIKRPDDRVTLRMGDHPVSIKNVELADDGRTVSLVVYGSRPKRKTLDTPKTATVSEYRYNKKFLNDDRIRAFLADVATLLETGEFPNRSNGNEIKVEPPPQTGMAREGVVLTAEQTVAVQNAMQKLVNASIEKDGTRKFQDFAERIFGTLGEGKRNVWEAMRPYLRNAWNQYGDLHEDLGLDEVSRADATRIFDELERDTIEANNEQEANDERTDVQSEGGQGGNLVGQREPAGGRGDVEPGDGANAPERLVPESGSPDVHPGLGGKQSAEGDANDAGRAGGRNQERGADGRPDGRAEVPVQPEGGRGGVRERDNAEQPGNDDLGGGEGQAQLPRIPAQAQTAVAEDTAPSEKNYVIPRDGNGGIDTIDTARKRIEANLAALRLLKRLEKEGRQATPEEQRVLSLYTGWGSLGEQLFDEGESEWTEERKELKALLTEEEYASARRTVQYAHYTPMGVIRGMYDILQKMGVQGPNLSAFEAGLGVGRFIGGLPEGLRGTRYTGVEMDPLTAAIAKQLYPQATVVTKPYQMTPALHGQFDFIVGNPPYGNIHLSDKSFPDGNGKSLHNFFIMKQIEALRPNGVAAFLVTHFFLDSKDQSARLWIHQRAQFLGAIRLPNALFSTVDANLATDIVFFRKRLPGEDVPPVVKVKKGKKGKDAEDKTEIPNESRWIYTTEVNHLNRGAGDKNPQGFPLTINLTFGTGPDSWDAPSVYYSPKNHEAGGAPRIVVSTRYGKDKPRAELVVDGESPTREGLVYTVDHNYQIRSALRNAFHPYTPPTPEVDASRASISSTQAETLGGGATHPSLLAGGHFVGADGKLYYTEKGFSGGLVAWPVGNYDEKAERLEYDNHPTIIKSGKHAGEVSPFDRWRDVRDPYLKFTPKEQDIMKALVKLREVRFDLMNEELSEAGNEDRIKELRKQLNEAYDAFQKAAKGYASKTKTPVLNEKAIKQLLTSDPAMSQLLGLEMPLRDDKDKVIGYKKSVVFERRVNTPRWKPLAHYDTAHDALIANLQMSGEIDVGWIAEHTGKTRDEVLEEITGRIFIDPETEMPVLREMYLSGDVKTKLEAAERAVAEGRKEFEQNVKALKRVIPEDIPPQDLRINIGNPIVKTEEIGKFAAEVLGFFTENSLRATYDDYSGRWKVAIIGEMPDDILKKYFVANIDFDDVVTAALENKSLQVYVPDPDDPTGERKTLDKNLTDQVNATVRQIRQEWTDWWPRSSIASGLASRYNERFNRFAEAKYDGSILKFQGLNPALTPYKHQRDAVMRTIITNNVLYNHVVGSGKTNTTIMSVMEMRRMGRVRKPVIVVPNHLVGQWRNEFLAAYPGANVLAADERDMNAENRKRYFARIQNGDYDVIIIPHSHLQRIPLSPDVQEEFINKEMAKLRANMMEAKASGMSGRTVKQIENAIQALEEKLRGMLNKAREDETGIFFDTMGIDGLFVDEAHLFKNVPFVSSYNVTGMGNKSGSLKAFLLMMKIDWFRNKRAGAPIVFLTGTPVSNSLTELFHNMRYMAPELLEKAKIGNMDAFIKAFGVIEDRFEPKPSGDYGVVTRLRKLTNLPELMRMVRTYMDVIDSEGLRKSMEAVGKKYDVPELETGDVINIIAKRSPLQEQYFGVVVSRTQQEGGMVVKEYNPGSISYRATHMPHNPKEDNVLKLIGDATLVALDMRLRKKQLLSMGISEEEIEENIDFPGSKVNLCVAQILKDYHRFNDVKGTQVVFLDRSTPSSAKSDTQKELAKKRAELEKALADAEKEASGATSSSESEDEQESAVAKVARLEGEVKVLEEALSSDFSVYDDIRKKLIAQGIPESEIAFIHDYNTKERKQALFDKVNAGVVRVLIGSTDKMGTGMNANKRMVSLHHLDAPWRPADMEQRNGRILRQGNLLMKQIPDFKVRIYQYGTERTADAYKFSTLLEKVRAFHNIYNPDSSMREIEELGELGESFENTMAELSGSPFIRLQVKIRERTDNLKTEVNTYHSMRHQKEELLEAKGSDADKMRDTLARMKHVQELDPGKPERKENYYEGVVYYPEFGTETGRQTFEAKTPKERQSKPDAKGLGEMLFDGVTNEGRVGTILYRGLAWRVDEYTDGAAKMFNVYAFDPADMGKGTPRRFFRSKSMDKGIRDEHLFLRMDNLIENAKESITKITDAIAQNDKEMADLEKELEETPAVSPKNQDYLESLRELEDISRVVNFDNSTTDEARTTLSAFYSPRGLPLPQYDWLKPEFDEKHGVSQQTGMTRGGWEKELQKKLDKAGLTEADLSAESQAYLAAKRAHEGAMPRSRIGKVVDFVGEVVTPREGETRREFIKRKGNEAAENLGKKLVDVRIPLINAVKEIVGDEFLPEEEDIATAMQLSYGRITAQHAEIDADYVRPVLDILVKQGMQVSDLDIYLSAKFAPERNRMIRERAEWKDAGAGLSDEEAAARLRGMEEQFSKAQMAALEKAAQIVYKMNRANLARLVESGILPQKQVEEWVKLSPHYVPLRDDLERLGAADVSGGMKHGRPFQKAVGRYSEALDSSFGWSVLQAKQGVVWAEQNRINKITVNFAKNHLSPEDYFVSKVPIKAEKVFSVRKGYRQEDAVPLRLDRPAERNIAEQYLKAGYTVVRSTENRNIVWVDGGEMDRVLRVRKGTDARRTAMPQNVVARIGGKRVYVFFDETAGSRGNKMGLAINRANMVHWDNRLWNTIAWLTRMKAMASTVWSVTFAARNAINDALQTTGITLMEGKYGVAKDVFRNYGQALKAFTAWRVSGQYDEGSEMGLLLKEAVRAGMLTGIYGKSTNFDQTMLDSVIAPLQVLEHRTGFGKNVKDTAAYSWNRVLAATSTFSEIPEVGIRLAVYAAMRQHGATATEAAVYAREITLDYNKKGEWTPVTNVLWMFSNASMQSLARWKKAWQVGNWKSRTLGVSFLLAAGFFTQLYNIMIGSALFGGDDDDIYKNIPDYTYDNNIPVLLPGGAYLTIPNRGVQAAVTRIGASLANLVAGDETPAGFLADASMALNPTFLENANPAGSSGSFLQTVAPTVVDPFVQLAENKTWTGAPVHAMDYGNTATPKWQDGFEKTSLFSKWLAKLLSDATGGDDVQGGKWDVYPEQIELVKNFIVGSIGTDFSGLSDMAQGNFSNMPVVRGLVRPLPDNTHRYYEVKQDVEKNLQIMRGYAVSSREKFQRHLERHPYLLKAKGFSRVKTAIEKLIDARREQLALGQDTAELDRLLEQYRQMYIDFYEGKM